MKRTVLFALILSLSACGIAQNIRNVGSKPADEISGESRSGATTDVRPRARPPGLGERIASAAAGLVPANARRADDFGQVSAADKAEAIGGAVQQGSLGTTVASLGSPAETGLWIKTPLVTVEQAGRVFYDETGISVAVTLIPLDGPKTAGSRLSLSAMQAIGAQLNQLPTVEIFAGA
ncbi:MAG: hypothetical protein ABJH45_04370 [Paracoccaceae bacterium]